MLHIIEDDIVLLPLPEDRLIYYTILTTFYRYDHGGSIDKKQEYCMLVLSRIVIITEVSVTISSSC